MEACHDEEVEDAVLEDCSHQPGHARLAVVGPVFQHEDDDANDGNKIYKDMRVPDLDGIVDNRYRRRRPVIDRSTRRSQKRRICTFGKRRDKCWAIEWLNWRSEGNNDNWMCVLPDAEGTPTSHKPVATEEATRIPKVTKTYLLASVRRYALGTGSD